VLTKRAVLGVGHGWPPMRSNRSVALEKTLTL
jgi:hypothetical protein